VVEWKVSAVVKFTIERKENIGNERIQKCFKELRARAEDLKDSSGNVVVPKEELAKWKFHICSINNFPTAAGLASSASGYCCLVYSIAQLLGVKGDVSAIARYIKSFLKYL
jgi:diphosphomevalonate decarboxylase